MAKKKGKNQNPSRSSGKPKNLRALYAQLRGEFTAADLQKFTEIEEGIPLEKVIGDMEEIHRKIARKRA
jgi:hypothetical protein